MRAHKVDLCLGDCSHTDLVVCPAQEAGKGAGKDDVPVPAGQTDGDPHHVLLRDETLNVAIIKGLLVGEGKSGVLCVPINSYDAVVSLAKLDQGLPEHLTGGDLGR